MTTYFTDPGPRVTQRPAVVSGHWTVTARPPRHAPVDITVVRGVPTVIGEYSFADPFGPKDLTLTFPRVTALDKPGEGDLWWLRPFTDIDVRWVGAVPGTADDWVWEGYMLSFSDALGARSKSVTCVGAMLQLDNYLAVPEYLSRPLPYELAILRQFHRSDLRMAHPRIEWPAGWSTVYTPRKGAQPWEIPAGVSAGVKWTAMLTRQTGSWDTALTSYISQLLAAMYTPTGQWTLHLDPGRVPVLRLRQLLHEANDQTLVIDVAAPGLDGNLDGDYSQSTNAAYGQGTSLTGYAYSGMRVSTSGFVTTYEPLAVMRQVSDATDAHGWRDLTRMRKEVVLQLQAGLNEVQARVVAQQHLERFAEPGITGSLTLSSDPTRGGEVYPRQLVRAGQHLQLRGYHGRRAGILLHITETRTDPEKGTVSLTVDSKFRDALTVAEVRLRGRDSLSVVRGLIAGQYQPPVPDQLYPWSYGEGSGYLPSGPTWNALRLFAKVADTPFPWTPITTARPPRAPAWAHCYAHIGPASPNANRNWARIALTPGSETGYPVRMAQAGTVRLIQVVALDRNGNVLPVPFHVGLYMSSSVSYTAMPMLPTALEAAHPPYKGGQHYPFFANAFEQYDAAGQRLNPDPNNAVESAGLVRVWGTEAQPAGYWPGDKTAAATGLLVDETQWSFDVSGFSEAQFDPYSRARNLSNPKAGKLYWMIYCDAQGSQDVYFVGRIFRAEPGANA